MAMSVMPAAPSHVNSEKKMAAKMNVRTVLDLSIGTTFY